jgi:hypothetical protein
MATAKVIEWYRPSQVKAGKWVAPSPTGEVTNYAKQDGACSMTTIIRPRPITQGDITRLLGREPQRGEGTFVKWLAEWLEYREAEESEAEQARRLR